MGSYLVLVRFGDVWTIAKLGCARWPDHSGPLTVMWTTESDHVLGPVGSEDQVDPLPEVRESAAS